MTVFSVDGYPQWEPEAMTIDLAPRDRWNANGGPITNPRGVNVHRMDGRISPHYQVYRDPKRWPTAWHWSVDNETGHLGVHLPWFVRGQHSNGGNVFGPAVEVSGYYYEPLSDAAVRTLMRLFGDFGETVGLEIRRDLGAIKEHREWALTTCPGDSYQRLYAAMARGGEEDMTPEEVRAIVREELAAAEKEYRDQVGASPARFATAITKRIKAINKATDLAVVPGEGE